MDTIDRIFELVKDRNTTQFALSKAIGVSDGLFSQWKRRSQKPSADVVLRIAAHFNVSTDYLFGIKDYPEISPKGITDHTKDETDLVSAYRKLTPNSKQIVQSVAQMELRHVRAVAQGDTPIRIIKNQKLKVFSQAAAAGTGNYLSDTGDNDYEMVSVPCIPAGTEFGIRVSGDSMEPTISDGDIVFVKRQSGIDLGEIGIFIYDGEAYCKKLVYRDNNYYLRSLNEKYKDIPLFGDDIYCVGKVLLD